MVPENSVPALTKGASLVSIMLKDRFTDALRSLGTLSRYEKFSLNRNPFPAIGIFSLANPKENQFYSEVFVEAANLTRNCIRRSRQKTEQTVIFVNADCGQGKSNFLGNLALDFLHDEEIYPIFCQIYTSGGFSIVAERAFQWIGVEGYCDLMLSFAESLGFEPDEFYGRNPFFVFGKLVSTLEESFMVERKTVERVMRPFLMLDEGYSRLIQTSHIYKTLILITLVELIKRVLKRKPLLIIDGLENRWMDINEDNRWWFFENVLRFLKLTKGESTVVFSDSNLLKEKFSQFLASESFDCTILKVDLPSLDFSKSLKLVSDYLISARIHESSCDSWFPFTKSCIRYLYKVAGGNTRRLVTLCHHLIETGVDMNLSRITVETLTSLGLDQKQS